MSPVRGPVRVPAEVVRSHALTHEAGGPLVLTLTGILDRDTTEALLSDLAARLRLEGPSVRVLEDMRGVTYISLQARRRAFDAIKGFRFQKWAIFGYSTFVGSLIRGLLKTTGRGDVRFFPDEASARAWLQEP